MIAIESLRYRWPGMAADCINLAHLQLAAGERIFLRGASGSGKSTLLNLFGGVLSPHAGSIRVAGQDLAALSAAGRDRFRADHIGFVFQQFNLLAYLPVLDNVLLPCRFSALRRQRALRGQARLEDAAHDLLRLLDLEPALWQRPAATLSIGQQQRVALARALIGAPDLLIADEPTSALDEARQQRFLAHLHTAARESGTAVLFASHDTRLSAGFDRVLDSTLWQGEGACT